MALYIYQASLKPTDYVEQHIMQTTHAQHHIHASVGKAVEVDHALLHVNTCMTVMG